MLVGLQPIYLLNVLGVSSKSSSATLCHFKKAKFSFTKASRWKFHDVKPTYFAVRIAAPLENNHSTTEELGEKVLYFRNTSTQICRYVDVKTYFFRNCRNDLSDVVDMRICGRLQFFLPQIRKCLR